MLALYRKYWKTAFDIGLIILTVYLVMFAFSYLYSIAAPIFFALVIFWIIEPFARYLNKKGLKKSLASAISIMLFVVIILGVIIGAGFIFTDQITNLIDRIPQYQDAISSSAKTITETVEKEYQALPLDIIERINSFITNFADTALNWIKLFLNWLLVNITLFSNFLFNLFIGIILAYFLSAEIEMWRRVAASKTPRTFKVAFQFLKENVFKGLAVYLKAQMKLISLTFVIVFVSLLLLDVGSAFSIALLAAVFDILPVLGIPVIFIPWAIYNFLVGETFLGIMLLVVLGVAMLTRQVLEPKITGNTLGVSAFTMLAFMIVSLSLFGVIGMIISPVLLILVKALYDQGYLKRWIRMPQEEFDSDPLMPMEHPDSK